MNQENSYPKQIVLVNTNENTQEEALKLLKPGEYAIWLEDCRQPLYKSNLGLGLTIFLLSLIAVLAIASTQVPLAVALASLVTEPITYFMLAMVIITVILAKLRHITVFLTNRRVMTILTMPPLKTVLVRQIDLDEVQECKPSILSQGITVKTGQILKKTLHISELSNREDFLNELRRFSKT